MTQATFWDFFNTEVAPHLGSRESSFRKTFEYLDQMPDPIVIIETGCIREAGSWSDGQSSILFDRYLQFRGNEKGMLLTVDINPEATKLCRSLLSKMARVHTGDSVAALYSLRSQLQPGSVSLAYLDSFDYWPNNPWPPAGHHLKELVALGPLISQKTLVVLDDSPIQIRELEDEQGNKLGKQKRVIGGKGFLVAEYAEAIGAQCLFYGYQAGFTGLTI